MKKLTLIAIVAFALSSCGSTNYLPCPAYGNVELDQEQYYTQLDCENCDEIN
tara:strand:+ start:114 stop:269 length:156 start_codon:yes stop_codon:yes gene_type:complete